MTASIRSDLLGGICGGLGYHLASNEIWRSAAATGKRIDQLTLRNEVAFDFRLHPCDTIAATPQSSLC